MSQINQITKLDKLAYKLYYDEIPIDCPIMGIEGFATREYNFTKEYYRKAQYILRTDKLNKLKIFKWKRL